MTFSFKTISNEIIQNHLNNIVIENNKDKRNDLIIKVFSLDKIHTAFEYAINKPIVILEFRTFNHENRLPTEEEYEEFFNSYVEGTKYKFENITEYKDILTITTLRKLLFDLYFEDDINKRMALLTEYLTKKRKKTIKRKTGTTKKELLDTLKSHNIYKIENYENIKKVPKNVLFTYCDRLALI